LAGDSTIINIIILNLLVKVFKTFVVSIFKRDYFSLLRFSNSELEGCDLGGIPRDLEYILEFESVSREK